MDTLGEGQHIGPYRIVRLLGVGGMGAVYEARREIIDQRVALKTLHPHVAHDQSAVRRFFNEAKALSQIEHPSIVHISDFGFAGNGTAYLVMEFLQGESLAGRLKRQRLLEQPLPLLCALRVGKEVAEVLATCHAKGIVHRDLKPDNLMLVTDPVAVSEERVKVLDFGIAKFIHNVDASGPRTGTKELLGTPMYMSPEQFSAAAEVDGKTDVYSLGCVLYETLAGRPPFIAAESWQFVGMHLFQTPVPLHTYAPDLPTGVYELVQRLLAKDKEARPSMAAAAAGLGKLLSDAQASESAARQLANPGTGLGGAPTAQNRTGTMDRIRHWLPTFPPWRRLGAVVAAITAGVLTATVAWNERRHGGASQPPFPAQPAALEREATPTRLVVIPAVGAAPPAEVMSVPVESSSSALSLTNGAAKGAPPNSSPASKRSGFPRKPVPVAPQAKPAAEERPSREAPLRNRKAEYLPLTLASPK